MTLQHKMDILFNIHRTEVSERSRLHIGAGIRLELVGEGDLYLECLSNYSVYVESFYLDAINNRAPGTAVHKFSSGAHTKVIFKRRALRGRFNDWGHGCGGCGSAKWLNL